MRMCWGLRVRNSGLPSSSGFDAAEARFATANPPSLKHAPRRVTLSRASRPARQCRVSGQWSRISRRTVRTVASSPNPPRIWPAFRLGIGFVSSGTMPMTGVASRCRGLTALRSSLRSPGIAEVRWPRQVRCLTPTDCGSIRPTISCLREDRGNRLPSSDMATDVPVPCSNDRGVGARSGERVGANLIIVLPYPVLRTEVGGTEELLQVRLRSAARGTSDLPSCRAAVRSSSASAIRDPRRQRRSGIRAKSVIRDASDGDGVESPLAEDAEDVALRLRQHDFRPARPAAAG